MSSSVARQLATNLAPLECFHATVAELRRVWTHPPVALLTFFLLTFLEIAMPYITTLRAMPSKTSRNSAGVVDASRLPTRGRVSAE
jgi:hypothetical protein